MNKRARKPIPPLADKSELSEKIEGHAYRQVADEIRNDIVRRKLSPEQQYYSLRALAQSTGRSMATIRRALALLEAEGLLETRERSGIFVGARAIHPSLGHVKNFVGVLPPFTAANEQFFTARILGGMTLAASQVGGGISLLQQTGAVEDATLVEQIKEMKPCGVVWLHPSWPNITSLTRLYDQGIPLVTTFRAFKELPLPVVRESDEAYARLVLEQVRAKGHASLMVVTGAVYDEYYESKLLALCAEGQRVGVRVDRKHCFDAKHSSQTETLREDLERFILGHPEETCVLVLFSNAAPSLCKLLEGSLADRLGQLSIIYNVLDGVQIPRLPTGECLATITPPLEAIGVRAIDVLEDLSCGRDIREATPLEPLFQSGDSLRLKSSFSRHSR